jgi:hypothetical protein
LPARHRKKQAQAQARVALHVLVHGPCLQEDLDMNLFTGESADTFFGSDVGPAVHALLHRAAASVPDDRTALLWSAQALAPTCLATYYVLYKHHAGRREFELAERAASRGLQEAAVQAGLNKDWRAVPAPLPAALCQTEPGRFWLFTLKALAFINLRGGRPEVARELLAHLEACAPDAHIGGDVTAALLGAFRP